MCLIASDLLKGIVIIDPQHKVITTAYEPVLPSNESDRANRNIGYLEGLQNCARFVIVDVYVACDCADLVHDLKDGVPYRCREL